MDDITTNILARLDRLEASITTRGANRGPPLLDVDDEDASSDRRLPTVMVAKRYGVTTRTIERWEDDAELAFPKPEVVINKRKYWSLRTLRHYDRERAAAGTKKKL
jgi:hypothetical protein